MYIIVHDCMWSYVVAYNLTAPEFSLVEPIENFGAVKLYATTYGHIQSCTIMYNQTLKFIVEIMHIYNAFYNGFYC